MGLWSHSRGRSALFGGVLLVLGIAPLGVAQSRGGVCSAGASSTGSPLEGWQSLVSGSSASSIEALLERAEALIPSTVALETVGREIFRDGWAGFRPDERDDFLEALAISLRDGLGAFLREEMGGRVPTVTPAGEDAETARFTLRAPDGRQRRLVVRLGTAAGRCAITDVEYEGERLVRELRDRVEDLVDDYSFKYMVAKLGGYDELILDDFESSPVGRFPVGWDQREDELPPPYRVREEDGNRYLEATDEGESVIIGMETPWNMEEYPYISFRIRVNEIPEGANERDDERVDSAAGVYVTVKKVAFGRIPESVKYVWSSTLPVGSATRRDGIGRPWQVVIGSGREGLGEWRTYVFDIRDAYRKTFGGNPGSKPAGIGVLSDANSMGGRAYADYDDFKALKRAPAGTDGGVVERLRPIGSQ